MLFIRRRKLSTSRTSASKASDHYRDPAIMIRLCSRVYCQAMESGTIPIALNIPPLVPGEHKYLMADHPCFIISTREMNAGDAL